MLGARPYLEICDRELAAAAPPGPQTPPALPSLIPAEQAVARLVATGRSNRQTAAELYQRQDRRVSPPAHLRQARHPIPARPQYAQRAA